MEEVSRVELWVLADPPMIVFPDISTVRTRSRAESMEKDQIPFGIQV
jgi:hypothetical protein